MVSQLGRARLVLPAEGASELNTSKILQTIQRMHGGFVKIVSYLQPVLLLAVRLCWGWQLATNGWAKLHNLGNVTDYFMSLDLPHPHAAAAFVSTV